MGQWVGSGERERWLRLKFGADRRSASERAARSRGTQHARTRPEARRRRAAKDTNPAPRHQKLSRVQREAGTIHSDEPITGMTPFALTKRQQSRVAEEGEASKRQRVSGGPELSRSTGIASGVSSSFDSAVWGRRLAGLIEDAWKVEELAQLLQETPEAEDGSLRERIWSSKQGVCRILAFSQQSTFAAFADPQFLRIVVCRASSEVGHQISSDEVLAASLVLDTFHKVPESLFDKLRKLSKRPKIASCLSLVLECVYGGQFDLSAEDVSKGSVALRHIIFGGTFEQVSHPEAHKLRR